MDAEIRHDFKALLLTQPFWDRRAFLRYLFAGHLLYRCGLGRVAISPATGQQGQKNSERTENQSNRDQFFSDQVEMGAAQTTRKP